MTKLNVYGAQADSGTPFEPRVNDPLIDIDGSWTGSRRALHPVIAEMVHDFRNILGTIHGLAQLELLENSGSAAPLDEIRTACRDGGDLCQQMLQFLQNRPAERHSFDLAEIVRRIESPLRVCIPERFSLEFNLEPAPVEAESRGLLQRMVLNLVKNAAESLAGRAGVVEITTGISGDFQGHDSPPPMRLAGKPLPASFLIISDTGCGMNRSRRTSLLKSSPVRRSGGHGLGFASVRRIVTRCGGTLNINSAPGEGTTISLAFPHVETAIDDIRVDPRLNIRTVQAESRRSGS